LSTFTPARKRLPPVSAVILGPRIALPVPIAGTGTASPRGVMLPE
jgi:hypothetical protein